MKLLTGQVLTLLLLALSSPAVGQSLERTQFRAIVHLKAGGRIKGTLDDIEKGVLYFTPSERIYFRGVDLQSASVPLQEIDWVLIKRTGNRQSIRTGIAAGALLGGYLGYQSSRKNRFQSPILEMVSIALSAASLATIGGMIGSFTGGATRRAIRPMDRTDPVESLERQLQPFTQTYQERLMLPVVQ